MRSAFLAGVLLLSSTAFAANPVVTLQNDSMVSGSSSVSASAQITTGEGYAATFKVEAALTPVRLRKVQVMMVDDPSWPGTECGSFSLRVFADTAVDAPNPDGAALYDSMADGEVTFDLPGTAGSLQEIDLTTGGFSPIWIEAAGLRVELHAESNMCLLSSTGNMHFPILAVDADGVSSPGLNFLFGYEKIDEVWTPTWYDGSVVGLSGDFVMRAVVETTGCSPNCAGKTCGSDGCQGTCGTCTDDAVCVAGTCCTPACDGKQCGSDGCGASCGTCAAGSVCNANGQCDCVPACAGRECGSDGCGGSCGTCGAGLSCDPVSNWCVGVDVVEPDVTEPDTSEPDAPEPDSGEPDTGEPDTGEPDAALPDTAVPDALVEALRVDSIVPNHGPASSATDVLIVGAGFQTGVTVRLDADPITVVHVDATTVEATVPMGLASGTKTLVVKNPDGAPVTIAAAYTVDADEVVSTGGGSGCQAGGPVTTTPALLLGALLLLGGVLAVRRARVMAEARRATPLR